MGRRADRAEPEGGSKSVPLRLQSDAVLAPEETIKDHRTADSPLLPSGQHGGQSATLLHVQGLITGVIRYAGNLQDMSNRNAILLRPQWQVRNQLTMPLVTYDTNGKISIRGLVQVVIPITVFLDTLFDDKAGFYTERSAEDDQFHIFKSIEGALQATGVDGKGCLLRTICEMQKNPIGRFTFMGEIATMILTPRRGVDSFLHEYLDAEYIGQSANMSCAAEFRSCPISLFNLFKSYSTADDKPSAIENNAPETGEPDPLDQEDLRRKPTTQSPLNDEHNHRPVEGNTIDHAN